MNADSHDLTKGSLPRGILLFSLPLILSNLLQVLFNMSDVAVVGRFAGEIPLGAVGSTTMLVGLFTGFLIGVGCGVNVLVARSFAGGDREELRRTVHSSLLISLFVGFLLLLLGLFCSRPMLLLLNTKEDLLPGAVLYMKIYFLGMPAMAVYNFGNAVFSAVGDTKRPLYYLTAAGLLNLGLNLFFVIVCRMDVDGVALASIISQYLSSFLILLALFRTHEPYGLSLKHLRLSGVSAKAILILGLPAGFQNAIFQIANLFIQSGVNSFDTLVVAGNSAAANADTIIYTIMAAFYTAASSYIGQNFAVGDRNRVRKTYLIADGYAFAAGAVCGALLLLFGREFLMLFTDKAEVAEAAMPRLRIMAFSYAVSAFMDNSIAASRGLGKAFVPTIIVVMGSCVFRIAWIYTVFAHFHTLLSLYLLYIFSWSLTGIAETVYFIHSYRKLMPKDKKRKKEDVN
ncbi:MAG: MATE family efflux transporter [Clostridia bacterium]|nr:MATE family efflux transporter [Clostridia bacterium]